MSKPVNFNQAAYQKRINEITGCSDGRPLIQLVWAPETFRWMPHKLGTDPPGYTFPVFCNQRSADGNYYGPDRWALMDRLEWGQYAPTWEGVRYKKHKGDVYDLRGPCPDEYYAELKCYSTHNGKCCDCIGESCKCEVHCWGIYMEPDEHLLDWVRRTSWEARHDSDVDPFADVRFFEAPQAQRDHVNAAQEAQAKNDAEVAQLDREARELFVKNPHTISGMKQTDSGLYIPS